MAGDDLKEHATSEHDFYELLGVTFETSESDIRRAYRKAALKYHPDKNAGKPEVVEKFHLLQIAYDVLSDPAIKTLYDNARRGRREKAERDQAFEGKRRKMKEDLERRESGFHKRKRDEEDDEDKLQREIRRLAEMGRRRRMEMQETVSREKLEEEERLDREQNGAAVPAPSLSTPQPPSQLPEIDRTVKARWLREGAGENIDKDRLTTIFEAFGPVESAFLLKDKKQRLADRKAKAVVATGVVVFKSVVGAHAAVEDYKKQTVPDFSSFQSVFWAAGQEPHFIPKSNTSASASVSPPTTPSPANSRPSRDIPGLNSAPSTPARAEAGGPGLRKVPSFASFKSPAATATPQPSPSYEELTLIRLRNAEKRKLEAQIKAEEEES